MPKNLTVFNHVTLNGFFVGADGDFSWAQKGGDDDEWNTFVAGNASDGGTLLFGRVTYELMASYWPTPAAARNDPEVAERMNNLSKVVFSRTLDHARWKNTKVVKSDIAAAVRRMKQEGAEDMVILGSGSIAAQLAQAGLIDTYQLIVNPVALGKGKTLFEGIDGKLNLKLTSTRAFRNGNVLLTYQPAA